LPSGNSSAERIIAGYELIKDIPYIRHYIEAAHGLAMDMVLTQPVIDKVRLKGFEATEINARRRENRGRGAVDPLTGQPLYEK